MREHVERLRRLSTAWAAAARLITDDREALEAEIEAAEIDGMSAREIARYTGLSPSTVHAIIVRRTAARQARQLRGTGLDS